MFGSRRNIRHESPLTPVGDSATHKTIAMLEELLTNTLQARDYYKSARYQDADIHFRPLHLLFDTHYKEQLRLVDVLVDRIRELGGASRVLAGALLQRAHLSYALRGHAARHRLLYDLLDAHELVLSAAHTAGTSSHPTNPSAVQDFAVGQVVLINDAQSCAVREQLVRLDRQSARVAESGFPYGLQD
ncbi:MAG: ferritin-like domain-containing protein [Steroidobacteraceae bacterium]|jgi:starvation-inducible DNA-binding protein